MTGKGWAESQGPTGLYSAIALDASRLRIRKPPRPTGRPRRLTVCLSDVHAPKNDPAAWSVALQAIRDLEPDGLYLMGDVMDNASMSTHHETSEADAKVTYRIELAAANRLLNDLDAVATKAWDRLWLDGNHETRTRRWVLNVCPPALRDSMLTVEDACRVRDRGYRFLGPGEQPFKVGNLHLLHGHFYSRHHAAKHLDTLGVSCVYGHVHTPQQFTTHNEHGHLQATCLPCLRTLDRDWAHMRRIHSWTLGFGVIEWIDGTKASVRNVYVIDGEAVYGGHVWRAK